MSAFATGFALGIALCLALISVLIGSGLLWWQVLERKRDEKSLAFLRYRSSKSSGSE